MPIIFFCSLSLVLKGQSVITGSLFESSIVFETLDANISDYQIYKIDVNKSEVNITSKNPFLNIKLGNQIHELNLYRGNLTTSYEMENKPLLLGGSTRKGGTVSMTVNDDFIFGYIKEGSSKIYIEPLRHLEKSAPSDLFVVYDVAHVIETGEHVCGSDQIKGYTIKDEELQRMPTTLCKVIDYAIANTRDMVTALGTVTDVMNFNLAVLNDVQTNYRSEFDANLEYDVVANFVPSSSANDPLSPNTGTTNASTLLGNFRNWARGPGNAGGGNSGGATGEFGVDYTIAGLWTDRDIVFNGSSGTVGLAYTPGWHHLLENYTAPGPSLRTMVSHEIGHNWNCGHDNSVTNIMFPSVLLTDVWAASSVSSVNSRVASQSYLDNCSTLGAPNANFFQSALAVCDGSSVEFEDQSQYGATRLWDFPTGTPSTSTDEKPDITYNTTGLHYTKVTSTNGAGSDDFLNYIDVQASPPSPCTPSGSGGSGGITGVSIANISNSSSATGIYEDFSCDDIATVVSATTYNMIVGVTGVSRIRYFVDYNNDGDFLDTGEASPLFTFGGNGNLSLNLTTNSSPVTAELLRFRIIVSTSSIAANGCTSPSTGQVEDYSMYFGVTQTLGCTDPAATNYDPNATVDDGSCEYGSVTWYRDFDTDTYGDPNVTQQSANQPAGYVADNTDCDDNNSNAFPGNPEVCDGADNNCDGNIDEGVLLTWYRDLDNDNFGNPNITSQACSQPTGFVADNTDCDDNDALEFPGQIWYKDFDGDGYGDGVTAIQCNRPANYYVPSELISTTGDCDDEESNAFPGNPEICDGIDNNCNNSTDEGVTTTFFRDLDNDTYGDPNVFTQACSPPTGFVLDNTDCNDNEANAFPGNPEVCDGVDNNCDGSIDEGLLLTWYRDLDNDNFGNPNITSQACSQPTGFVADNTDCDDNDSLEFPGQIWYKDFDGDGYGNGATATQCNRPANYFAPSELISTTGDCDDEESNAFPGNTEVCDGIDNNCDGNIDEGGMNTYYRDIDQDEFGDPNVSMMACTIPAGFVLDNTDCDDFDENEYPGQKWYKDVDGDGYSAGAVVTQCERPTNYYFDTELTQIGGDCNDNETTTNPGAQEICDDGIDNNCNGFIDEVCGPCDGTNVNVTNIASDEYRASNQIISNATLNNNQDLLFTAENSIYLNAGFEIEAGSVFLAGIFPCDNSTAQEDNDLPISLIDNSLDELESGVKEKLGSENTFTLKVLNKFGEEVFVKLNVSLTNLRGILKSKLTNIESGYYIINATTIENSFTKSIFIE